MGEGGGVLLLGDAVSSLGAAGHAEITIRRKYNPTEQMMADNNFITSVPRVYYPKPNGEASYRAMGTWDG